jgi:hypothetical protein
VKFDHKLYRENNVCARVTFLLYKQTLPEMPNLNKVFGFEVLIMVTMKSAMFWDVTPCSLAEDHRCFGGTYCLHTFS